MRERLQRRVVITGLGAVTPIGLNVPDFFAAAVAGECGIDWLPEEYRSRKVSIGAQVRGFQDEEYFDPKSLRRIHRVARFAYAAAVEALRDAGLLSPEATLEALKAKALPPEAILQGAKPEDVASVISSGDGGSSHVAKMQEAIQSIGRLSAEDILQIIPCRVNKVLTFRLPVFNAAFTMNNACASSGDSIAVAADMIRLERAKVVLAGGSEAMLDRIGVEAFTPTGALCAYQGDNPKEACAPFDKRKAKGFVLGEGSGVLVLEELEHARRRGARILCELIGYYQCSDSMRQEDLEDLRELGLPSNHVRNSDTDPTVVGAKTVMIGALEDAGKAPDEVDYISAHGPGTAGGGAIESLAIHRVYGRHLVPVSSLKAAIGHMIAGVGSEIAAGIRSMHEGIIPPTLNFEEGVRDDVNFVGQEAQRAEINIFMKTMYGFGGGNAALVFQREVV